MKKLLSIVISALILGFIYWKIGPENRARLVEIFRDCDQAWMALSLGMVVPLTMFTAWRLQQLMPGAGHIVQFLSKCYLRNTSVNLENLIAMSFKLTNGFRVGE